jgi:outer membrane biogenesis lipoprotein LolB
MGYGLIFKQLVLALLATLLITGCSSDTHKKEKLLA